MSGGGGVNEQVSEWSNPRVFKAIVSGVTIGGINIKFAFLVLLLVFLFVVSGGVLLYFGGKVRWLNKALLSKEVREAQESVREGLSEIRRDLLEELRILESSGKQLSVNERARKEHILRELDLLERNMSREISDIERKM